MNNKYKRKKDAVTALGVKKYNKITQQKLNFKEFLLSDPKFDDLKIQRIRGAARKVEL